MPCLIGGTRGGVRRLASRRSSCEECASCGSSTSLTKPQDSEWKFNIENQMKEMMASLKAIGEQLNNKPVMSREGALSNRNWRGLACTAFLEC
jgi:hypothetical protein